MAAAFLRSFPTRAASVVAAITLVVSLGACGDDSSEGDAPPPSSTTTTTTPEAVYATKHFRTPLDIAVPEWLDSEPQEDSVQFVTWESPDGSRALRILHPVEVYPPGSDAPVSPPDDFESYLLNQGDSGGEFTDQAETEIDGKPATVITATTAEPLDGSLGCPEAGVPADACFGLQPDLAFRLAVTETDAGPLLIWLRVARDADLVEEAARFDDLLAGIRFADREPEVKEVAATPFDGEYEWTLTAEDGEAHDPNHGPESAASYPWNMTLVLENAVATLTVESVGYPTETYRGTYDVEGDEITFHLGGPDATYALTQDPDGTIHATPVEPIADPGGAYVMTAKPWTKTG